MKFLKLQKTTTAGRTRLTSLPLSASKARDGRGCACGHQRTRQLVGSVERCDVDVRRAVREGGRCAQPRTNGAVASHRKAPSARKEQPPPEAQQLLIPNKSQKELKWRMHARAGRRQGFGDGQSEARRVKLRMTGVTCARVRASVLVILTPNRDETRRDPTRSRGMNTNRTQAQCVFAEKKDRHATTTSRLISFSVLSGENLIHQ